MRARDVHLGTVAEAAAARGRRMRIALDEESDLAPGLGLEFGAPELSELVRDISGWLFALGVRAGDRVAIVRRNHPDVLFLAQGAARIGAIPVTISPALDGDEVAALLRTAGPTVVVTDDACVAKALNGAAALSSKVVTSGSLVHDGCIALEDVRGSHIPAAQPSGPDDPMLVTHTSGTTGLPKLVVHRTNSYLRVVGQEATWAMHRRDTFAACLSWVHGRSHSLLMSFLCRDVNGLLIANPEPAHVEKVFAERPPSIVETHPNLYMLWEPIARGQSGALDNVRLYLSNFDAIHPRSVRVFMDASSRKFPLWLQVWGQTEIGPLTGMWYTRGTARRISKKAATTSGSAWARSVGWSLGPMGRARVRPLEGASSHGRKVGRLEGTSKSRSLTYLGLQTLHEERCRGKWWTMGDVGERGFWRDIRLLDREIDMIEGFGSAVSAEDRLLERLPEASEIVIVRGRSEPVPVVSTFGDVPLASSQWRAATTDLPPMSPPVVVPWDSIPRTGSWKVRRPILESMLNGTSAE